MSAEQVVYSIQQTYIIKPVSKSEKHILTCDERIDIPTIEPLPGVKPIYYEGQPLTVIPCIELAGEFLSEFNLKFETNEGVTVLPVKLAPSENQFDNPYSRFRYVLVLPRGATGVKECKAIHKATGKEVQHNLTFGIMPPPYNYDNVLFGYNLHTMVSYLNGLMNALSNARVSNILIDLQPVHLPKGEGEQPLRIVRDDLFFYTQFIYPSSPEPAIHKPVITVISGENEFNYTLSLNKTKNTVVIDLFTGMITAYDSDNGEIIQQFMLSKQYNAFNALVFGNFDDIDGTGLDVHSRGAHLNV